MNISKLRVSSWLLPAILALTISAYAAAQQGPGAESQPSTNQTTVAPVLVVDSSTAPGTTVSVPAVPAPPPASSSFNFKGFYVGAHGGYGTGNREVVIRPLPSAATFVNLQPQTLHPSEGGAIGGGQFGYNWTFNDQLLVGVEADISFSGMDGTETVTPIIQNGGIPFPGGFVTAHTDIPWYATMRPRLGGIWGRFMFYGTAGLAFGSVRHSANTNFLPVGTEQYPATIDETKAGWAAGAGTEIALNHRWGLGFEYLHIDLGNPTVIANPVPPLPPFGIAYSWQTTINSFNGKLNFRW